MIKVWLSLEFGSLNQRSWRIGHKFLPQITDGMNVTQINTVVCDSGLLANYVNTTDAASLDELSKTLCELSDPEVIDLVATIHSELDAKSILLEFEAETVRDWLDTFVSAANVTMQPLKGMMPNLFRDWDSHIARVSQLIMEIAEGMDPLNWTM